MIPIRLQNCTLGIFGLKSWEPARSIRSQVMTANDSRNNVCVEGYGRNTAPGAAEHLSNNSKAQWLNPTSPVFVPRTDVTTIESRESGQWAANGNGQSAGMNGQWPAKDNGLWTASVNGQPAKMNRQWSPGEERMSSNVISNWSANNNVEPANANGQWSANGNARPANANGQWSAGGNAHPPNADGQWPANENVQQATRQWSVNGNAQSGSDNRQWSATGVGQSPCTDGQWLAKESGPPSTFATRQREERENGCWSNPAASSAFVPKGNITRSDPDKSFPGLDRQKSQRPNPGSSEFVQKTEPVVANRAGYRLIAKHNYTANPNSPLGAGAELSFRQAEQLTKTGVHPEQELWWLAKNENGQQGYVPSTYMMVIEDNGTLPWLQNRVVEEKEEPAYSKPLEPYRSAYNKGTTSASKYNCDICGRSFNGPQPYGAHMVSRAHKEAVELHQEYR